MGPDERCLHVDHQEATQLMVSVVPWDASITATTEEELTQPKKGQCPGDARNDPVVSARLGGLLVGIEATASAKSCHDDCIQSSERLECIHLGADFWVKCHVQLALRSTDEHQENSSLDAQGDLTQEAGTEGHNGQFAPRLGSECRAARSCRCR